jgi:hypothetical protein
MRGFFDADGHDWEKRNSEPLRSLIDQMFSGMRILLYYSENGNRTVRINTPLIGCNHVV